MQRESAMDGILEQHNIGELGTYLGTVLERYKAHNEESLEQNSDQMSDEQRINYMRQLEPVVVDPNEIAELRQRLVEIDMAMKQVDPRASVYSHPKTKRVANWLARESGPFTPGFLKSGEQKMEGLTTGLGETMALAEGVTGFGLNMLAGAADLTANAIKGIMGEEYGLPFAVATNYVEDENGRLVNNGGKVPGIVSIMAAVNAQILGQNVLEYVNRVGAAREFERLNESGFDYLSRGAAGIAGIAAGFGPIAGGAMGAGKALAVGGRIGGGTASIGKLGFTMPSVTVGGLATKGLMRMAASGASPRVIKLTKILAGTGGAMVANGLAEGLAFGRTEGYGHAFVGGMAMAPVLMAFGAMGRSSERFLTTRAKMPQRVAQSLSGALEGAGFGALEAHQTGALWMLMKDPTRSNWEIFAKNMLGFALFKGMAGRSVVEAPTFGEAQGRQTYRQGAREALGEEVARADVVGVRETIGGVRETIEGREPTVPEGERGAEQIKGVLPGPEAQMKQAARGELVEGEIVRTEDVMAERTKKAEAQGRDPLEDPDFMKRPEAERRAITEAGAARERRIAAEEFEGPERRRAEGGRERPAEAERLPPTPEGEAPARLTAEEIRTETARLRAEGPTPENRARLIELLNAEKGRITEGVGEAYRRIGKMIPQPHKQELRIPRAVKETPAEVGRREDLEARVRESGMPRDLLSALGRLSRARKAARSPAEEAKLWKEQRELEKELDALEMSQDPLMNAKMREALAELEVEELDVPVDPEFGERAGPESMRAPASPFRQQESLLRPGEEPVRASDIIEVLKGRPGFPGIRMPFTGRRRLSIPGSAVQIAIRSGRISGKGTAGVFKIFENLTRTKEGMDLVVSLHEWAHGMQRQVLVGEGGEKFSRGVKKWFKSLPEDAQNDMGTILRNYPGWQKLPIWGVAAEAWAEWHARKLLGDPTLEAEVPALSRELNAWLARTPELRTQYGELTQLIDTYKRQGAEFRVDQSIRRGKTRKQGTVAEQIIGAGEKAWDAVVKGFFDDMHLLKKSQRKWLELSSIDEARLSIMNNPSRVFDLLAMTASKQAESFIHRGTHNLALERTGESLENIFHDVARSPAGEPLKGKERASSIRDFVNYLVSTRSLELIGHGKKQTLPKSDYLYAKQALLNRHPEFAGLAKRMKVWSDALLDLVAEAGNVPQADIQRMKDYSTVYIPFVRALEGAVKGRPGRGVAERGGGIKGMKGGTQEILDPMRAMMEVTTTMIAKAHQQMVMKSLYKTTLVADVGGLATVVPKSNVPSKFRLDQVFRQMEQAVMKRLQKEGLEGEELEGWDEAFGMFGELLGEAQISDQLITLFGQKVLPFGEGANIIAYTPRLTEAEISELPKHGQVVARRQNEEMQWLEVDADAYTALLGLDQPVGPTFLDNPIMQVVFVKPWRMTRFFATEANPAFVVANSIRDTMSATVFSQEGEIKYNPLAGLQKFTAGAALMLGGKNQRVVDMYEASGASSASLHSEGVRREMRGEATTMLERSRETISKAIDKWRGWMGKPESFIRIEEFRLVHERAIAAGKSPVEAGMEALEAAKEITVNFARAGGIARSINQYTPYFTASFAGQRKMLRSIAGMEGRNDGERARMQQAAFVNGLVSITMPTLAVWALTHDEDWYRDLPEWRKTHFINMKLPGFDTIVSVPLPFELGVIFGSMPAIMLDHITDSNPASLGPALWGAMFPYLSGVSSLLPAGARPILEAVTGYDFFTQKKQTPFWTEKGRLPAEQMRADTTVVAQEMFKAVGHLIPGIDNPIELQHAIGGYTAGASITLMKSLDELFDLKGHPGIAPGVLAPFSSFLNRFARQTPHRSSRAVDEFYERSTELEQMGPARSQRENRLLKAMNRDRKAISAIRKQVDRGSITPTEGDRRIYEMARRSLERSN